MPSVISSEKINSADLLFVRQFMRRECGLSLDEDKSYLIEARLFELARRRNQGSVSAVIHELRVRPSTDLKSGVVDALATHETSFFRDLGPFDALRTQILPELFAEKGGRGRPIRIWSAACSTGQEPYSLALHLTKHFAAQMRSRPVELYATDISHATLEKAKSGRFTQLEVNRGLPAPLLVKHFTQEGRDWVVRDEIRKMIRFQYLNLMDSFSSLGAVDVVFCCNVLIYFELAQKVQILNKIRTALGTSGTLFMGRAESLYQVTDTFNRVMIGGAIAYRPAFK